MRSAPARLDVLGGLAAQAGGTLAQIALPLRVTVTLQPRADSLLIIESDQISPPVGEGQVTFDLRKLHQAGDPTGEWIPAREVAALLQGPAQWASPLVALWYTLLTSHPPKTPAAVVPATAPHDAPSGPGATLLIRSTIPLGAGQASSTALLAATLLAWCDARQIHMEPLDQALAIQRAESLADSHGGPAHAIDALTCLLADTSAPSSDASAPRPRLLRYSAQPHQFVGFVPLPDDVRILALDTGVRYTAANETLENLRLAGAMGFRIIETIYRDLGQRHTPLHGYLANVSPLLYRQYFRALTPRRMRGSDFIRTYGELPERAGRLDPAAMYRVRTAVDHLISEHEHAEQFLQAIEELSEDAPDGQPRNLTGLERERLLARAGRLLLASHHSYRLRLELSCREADWLVDRIMEAGPDKGLFGARITASGGGGTVALFLQNSRRAQDALLDVYNAYNKITGLALGISEAGTSPPLPQ